VLPVQGGDQLTAVEFGGIQDWQNNVAREKFFGNRHERPLRYRQYSTSKDEVYFDSDLQSVAFDKQFDLIAAFRGGQASAVAHGRNRALGGFEVCGNCAQCVLAAEGMVGEHNVDVDGEPRMSCRNKLSAVPPLSAKRGDWNTPGAIASSKRTVSTYS